MHLVFDLFLLIKSLLLFLELPLLTKHLPTFAPPGLNQQPSASQPRPLQTELPPPQQGTNEVRLNGLTQSFGHVASRLVWLVLCACLPDTDLWEWCVRCLGAGRSASDSTSWSCSSSESSSLTSEWCSCKTDTTLRNTNTTYQNVLYIYFIYIYIKRNIRASINMQQTGSSSEVKKGGGMFHWNDPIGL